MSVICVVWRRSRGLDAGPTVHVVSPQIQLVRIKYCIIPHTSTTESCGTYHRAGRRTINLVRPYGPLIFLPGIHSCSQKYLAHSNPSKGIQRLSDQMHPQRIRQRENIHDKNSFGLGLGHFTPWKICPSVRDGLLHGNLRWFSLKAATIAKRLTNGFACD